MVNPLLQALECAADKHGAPVIGSVSRRGGSFAALIFSDDHTFVAGSDNYTVYEFDGRSTAAGVYSWRDLGTRSNVLDTMAGHAEQHLAASSTPERDEYNAEWYDALRLADERKAQRTAKLRAIQSCPEMIDDERAAHEAQRYAGAVV
jgi:hypothetical protein